MNIRLYIERLVVDGVALEPGGSRRLQSALETELTRLLSGGGELHPALLSGGMMPRLEVESIALRSDGNAAQLGKAIAGTLYGGLKGTRQE